MSYHIVFVTSDTGPPIDGEHVASSQGYTDFGTFAEEHADRFPTCAQLVEHGWAPAHGLPSLVAELPKLATAARPYLPDVAHVAESLLGAVQARPAGTIAVIVSDGEPGDDEPLEGDLFDEEPAESDVYG